MMPPFTVVAWSISPSEMVVENWKSITILSSWVVEKEMNDSSS
jgi:hypothetical protein